MNRYIIKVTVRNAKTHNEKNHAVLWHEKNSKPNKKEIKDFIVNNFDLNKYDYLLTVKYKKYE